MLGGLAAHQGALGLAAALGDAGDDLRDAHRVIFAAGDVVQEEEGGSAAADDVVDAHGHAVDADGVMLVHQQSQAQLGAHAVGAGDQDGLFHTRQLGGEHAAEAAQGTHHAGDVGGLHHGLDALDGLVTGGDVHAGGGVGRGMGVFHLKTSSESKIRKRGEAWRQYRLVPRFPFHTVWLLFTVPAVGADLVPVDADGLQEAVQGLVAQGVKAHLLADGL